MKKPGKSAPKVKISETALAIALHTIADLRRTLMPMLAANLVKAGTDEQQALAELKLCTDVPDPLKIEFLSCFRDAVRAAEKSK